MTDPAWIDAMKRADDSGAGDVARAILISAQAAVDEAPLPENAAELLSSRSVVFELYIGAPQWRRQMATSDLAAPDVADPDLIHVSKDLIDTKALGDLNAHARWFKEWLRRRSVPCRLLRGGMRLIPNPLVIDTDKKATQFIEERKVLVQKLIERYTDLKEDAKVRLGTHYREDEYPTEADLTSAFDVRVNWLSIDIPKALQQLDAALYARQAQKVEVEWREAYGEIRDVLRASFLGLVDHLAKRLGTKDDGKKMILRDSAIVKVREFIVRFAARNLTNDTELADIAAKARNILAGVEPEDIRSNELVRESVRERMEEIKTQLDGMVIPAPRRRFAAAAADGRV